jgi:DNA-binding NarL/FixJ family response regulator
MTEDGTRTTVLIADDHPVVRSGLRALVERHDDLAVVGEAADPAEALRKTRGHKPDVLVLDLMMGESTSVDVIPDLCRPITTRGSSS